MYLVDTNIISAAAPSRPVFTGTCGNDKMPFRLRQINPTGKILPIFGSRVKPKIS